LKIYRPNSFIFYISDSNSQITHKQSEEQSSEEFYDSDEDREYLPSSGSIIDSDDSISGRPNIDDSFAAGNLTNEEVRDDNESLIVEQQVLENNLCLSSADDLNEDSIVIEQVNGNITELSNTSVRPIKNKTSIKQYGWKRVRNPDDWLCNKRKKNLQLDKSMSAKRGKLFLPKKSSHLVHVG
jgi:hypothetical protein